MASIDAHQHFWKYNSARDSWITADMAVIQRDFLPEDLKPVLQQNGLEGSVIVQSDQSEAENVFQLANAASNSFIKGVVGWVDLQAIAVTERLAYYSHFPKMKGFRHVLQGESDRALMLQPAFKKGIASLKQFGFTYDILIYPDQLEYAATLVSQFPDQLFVIDHIAKPGIKDKELTTWKNEMVKFKDLENVFCKISGMVTEASWHNWKTADFIPYLDVVVETFGTRRIMFGSDWPVCLVAASYSEVMGIVKKYFSAFSTTEQQSFFGDNAMRFYNLT